MNLKSSTSIGIVVVLVCLSLGAFVLLNSILVLKPVVAKPVPTPSVVQRGFITGSIEVLTDDGFTLVLPDGSIKDVNLSATTTIQNYTSASAAPSKSTSDQLSVGEQVAVLGSEDSDGTIEARVVRTGVLW